MPRATNPHSLYGGKIGPAQIASDAVTTIKTKDANVTSPKAEAALRTHIANIVLSFGAAAELGTFKIYFPKKVTINKIRTVVTKVIGSTSAAYAICQNVSGVAAIVTIAASAAIGEEDSATITENNVIAADSWLSLTTSKAGNYAGMIEAFVEYTME
jgi:hypothetical protein